MATQGNEHGSHGAEASSSKALPTRPEHVAALCGTTLQMEDVRRSLDLCDATSRTISLFDGGLQALPPVLLRHEFDVLIVCGVCAGLNDLQQLAQILLHHTQLPVILITENMSSEFVIAAMRMGVRDVLHLPVDAEALSAAIGRIEHNPLRGTTPGNHKKIIAFLPSKGGSGATVLATNLGHALGQAGARTILLDLNLQFGDAALYVSDKVPASNVADVVGANLPRLDASFLASSVVDVTPNFVVLAAPEQLERAAEVRPDDVEALIKAAARHYDFVVLDLGRILDAVTVRALDQADVIYLVLQQTLPFVRDAKRTLEALRALGYPDSRVRLLVNRFQKSSEIGIDDVELSLGLKVNHTLPNRYATVSAAVNQGMPLARVAKRDPVAKGLQTMALELLEREAPKKPSWFRGWLHQS